MARERPPPSNLPIYVGLLTVVGLTFVCLTSWLGTAVVYVIAAIAGVCAIAFMHYVLWGSRPIGGDPSSHEEGESQTVIDRPPPEPPSHPGTAS